MESARSWIILGLFMLGAACGASAKPAASLASPGFPNETQAPASGEPRSVKLEEFAGLRSLYEKTSADDPKFARKDLDVELVVGLVQERLSQVAVRAMTDLLKKLSEGELPIWGRDLLAIAAKLPGASAPEARVLAERALRALGRAVLAEAVVASVKGAASSSERRTLADWTYWALAGWPALRDDVAPPTCREDDVVCTRISNHPQGAKQAIEEALRLKDVFDAVRMVARFRAKWRASPAKGEEVLRLLMSAAELGGLSKDDLSRLIPVFADLEVLRTAITQLKAQCESVKDTMKEDIWKEWAATVEKQLAQNTLGKSVEGWIVELVSAEVAAKLRELFKAIKERDGLPKIVAQTAICKELPVVALPQEVLSFSPRAKAIVHALQNVTSIEEIFLDEAVSMRTSLEILTADLGKLTDIRLTAAIPEELKKLRGLARILDGAAFVIEQAQLLAGDAVSGKVGEVRQLLRRLQPSAPLLRLLGPVFDALLEEKGLGREALVSAVGKLDPVEVMEALGLGGICKDDPGQPDGSWQCWLERIALSVHGALSFEGKKVALDANALVRSFADLATIRSSRQGSFQLLASVGTGALYARGTWQPLVAEQLGGAVLLRAWQPLSISAGAYVSGLLYRYVLDGQVSDGVMAGITVRARLYDLIELHADLLDVISFDGTNGDNDWGAAFGVQVPLGDYLQRSKN